MSYNYTLRYRTFQQLLSDCQIDFQNYNLQNMIEPQQLIKVAKRVNYDLGLRINMTKEAILEVEKGRVKLPDDFYTLNFGLICEDVVVQQFFPQGTHIEELPLAVPYKETLPVINTCTPDTVNCAKCNQLPCGCVSASCPGSECGANCSCESCITPVYNTLVPYGDYCVKPRVFMNCKNECYELVQKVNGTTYTYRNLLPLRIIENPESIECDCPNLYLQTGNKAWIQNGFLFTNFTTGKVYINYQGQMEDDQGNLLVPDHDMLNEYYEYAVKKRILENLIMNDENVNQAKIQLIEAGYRTSRNYALSIVNTPNFAEMKRVWLANRKAMYARYYDMFKSYPWYQWDRNPNDLRGEKIIR
jgi:hypothetical protein